MTAIVTDIVTVIGGCSTKMGRRLVASEVIQLLAYVPNFFEFLMNDQGRKLTLAFLTGRALLRNSLKDCVCGMHVLAYLFHFAMLISTYSYINLLVIHLVKSGEVCNKPG